MSEYRSPYLVTRHEIYVADDTYYPDLQKKVLFRAAKIPPKSSRWDHVFNVAFWAMLCGLIYWLDRLGLWDWMWRLAQ